MHDNSQILKLWIIKIVSYKIRSHLNEACKVANSDGMLIINSEYQGTESLKPHLEEQWKVGIPNFLIYDRFRRKLSWY